MFIVRPRTLEEYQYSIQLLDQYEVEWHLPEVVDGATVMIVITGGEEERLAEMAFQMAFWQDNRRICAACRKAIEETGEGPASCGHLTFTSVMNSLTL